MNTTPAKSVVQSNVTNIDRRKDSRSCCWIDIDMALWLLDSTRMLQGPKDRAVESELYIAWNKKSIDVDMNIEDKAFY